MPALTRSRLDEIRSLVGEVTAAMARRSSRGLAEKVAAVATAVDEVNASLADIDAFLLDGLRDEAVSMHDPELVPIARLLDLRSRPEWVTLHGWLLEKGEPPPAPPNVEAAEQFAAAIDQVDLGAADVATLRRLALERAPLPRRLEVLRRLRAVDPTNQVWIDAVEAHEEERIRELRLAVPRAVESGDIAALAELSEELTGPAWERLPPADLPPLVAGTVEARSLSELAVEAELLAAEIAHRMAGAGPVTPAEIDAAAELRTRLLELRETAEGFVGDLAHHPRIMQLVRSRGLDTAVRRSAEGAAESCSRIERLAAGLATKRDFTAACQRLEYLCDHLPERGGEGQWLADVQRHELIARAACQENAEHVMPLLLRERLQRGLASVDSREQLRRRFWVVTSAAVVAAIVAIAALVGWLVWQRGAHARLLRDLERRGAEAAAGYHTDLPRDVQRAADRHRDDDQVGRLVEEFESGVDEEKRRMAAFQEALADCGERLEDLAADVQRREQGRDTWLEAWPPTYEEASNQLAAARRLGGLPDRRGTDEGDQEAELPPPARQRFQAEEDELAELEARQARLERMLAQWASDAFGERLDRIREGINDSAAAGRLLDDARDLRREATAPRAMGLPNAGPRVPASAVATLDALIKKLEQLAREGRNRDTRSEP